MKFSSTWQLWHVWLKMSSRKNLGNKALYWHITNNQTSRQIIYKASRGGLHSFWINGKEERTLLHNSIIDML